MAHKLRTHDLDVAALAKLFGAPKKDIIEHCGKQLASLDLRYRILRGEERKRIIGDVLMKIGSGVLAPASKSRRPDWEIGWSENLQDFVNSDYAIDSLVPKYFKKNVPARLDGEYIKPSDADFVFNVSDIFRKWLFQKYFNDVDAIYEFGCGSGWHLALLAQLYPDKKVFGFDWALSSRKIINLMAKHYKWPVKSGYFDFFHPDDDTTFLPNSAVLTFGALEQLGRSFKPYLKFILNAKPKLCVDVAGINEFYDPKHLLDELALRYHRRRNYLSGYLTYLRSLEKKGRVKIIKYHHQRFGNIFDDPHSYVIWKPLGSKGDSE